MTRSRGLLLRPSAAKPVEHQLNWISMWCAVVAAGVAAGFVAGAALDAVMWRVSRDYVYLPGHFLASGWPIGLLAGTVAGASAIYGRQPLPSAQHAVRAVSAASLVMILSALGGGLVGGLVGKLGPASSDEFLAPIARVYTCEGLWRGALVGTAAATLTACAAFRRFRDETLAAGRSR